MHEPWTARRKRLEESPRAANRAFAEPICGGRGLAGAPHGLCFVAPYADHEYRPARRQVGRHRGGPKGTQEFFYLTINADQTLVAEWGINWSWGRVTLANGQATYQMNPPPLEGTLRFYQGNGKPTLYMNDLWANFYAVVTKQP